jgi:hypothetical protein
MTPTLIHISTILCFELRVAVYNSGLLTLYSANDNTVHARKRQI